MPEPAGEVQSGGIVIPMSTPPVEQLFRVGDVKTKNPDGAGRIVEHVFSKRLLYAIYQADNKVFIQYADDPTTADAQAQTVADLLCLRRKLEYLADGLTSNQYYNEQLASAFQVAFDHKPDVAKEAHRHRRVAQGRGRTNRIASTDLRRWRDWRTSLDSHRHPVANCRARSRLDDKPHRWRPSRRDRDHFWLRAAPPIDHGIYHRSFSRDRRAHRRCGMESGAANWACSGLSRTACPGPIGKGATESLGRSEGWDNRSRLTGFCEAFPDLGATALQQLGLLRAA